MGIPCSPVDRKGSQAFVQGSQHRYEQLTFGHEMDRPGRGRAHHGRVQQAYVVAGDHYRSLFGDVVPANDPEPVNDPTGWKKSAGQSGTTYYSTSLAMAAIFSVT